MSNDPWKHRSAGMRCQSCMWFAPKATSVGPGPINEVGEDQPRLFGRCRRHAPTIGGFPAVFGDDWCGDHRLDENKV